jgi:hypothetical protein
MPGFDRIPIPTPSKQIRISKLVEKLLAIKERKGDIGVMTQQFWDEEQVFVKIEDVQVVSSQRNGLVALIV